MKQPEDNKTMDMLGDIPPTHTSQQVKRYSFYIVTSDANVVTWDGLTRRAAEVMYANTERRTPEGVRAYGWECETGSGEVAT
jgi:hypothetical protein